MDALLDIMVPQMIHEIMDYKDAGMETYNIITGEQFHGQKSDKRHAIRRSYPL